MKNNVLDSTRHCDVPFFLPVRRCFVAGSHQLGTSPGGSKSGGGLSPKPPHHDGLLEGPRLEFDVADFFTFGSPLANVLAYRKILVRTK